MESAEEKNAAESLLAYERYAEAVGKANRQTDLLKGHLYEKPDGSVKSRCRWCGIKVDSPDKVPRCAHKFKTFIALLALELTGETGVPKL
jgi:rubrerythrin